MPPLATIVMPLLVGTWLTTLGIVDLAIDLSEDGSLLFSWYNAADTLPIISTFFQRVLPVLLIGLLGKCLLKSVPAAFARKPGGLVGCAPLVLLPVIIFTTLRAKALLSEVPVTRYRMDIRADELAEATRLHMLRTYMGLSMLVCAIFEYAQVQGAAVAALKGGKAA